MSGTLYDALGVAADADAAALRRAYLDLARRHHPDRPGGDADRMRAVNEAWAVLSDPDRRRRYDLTLAPSPRPAHDRFEHETFDHDDDEDDDEAFGRITMVVPRWLAMVPVALFAVSLALFGLGTIMVAPPLLAFALMTFVLSVLLFFAAPFIALALGRRANR